MNITKKLSVLLLSSCLFNVALATESINYSYSEYNQLKAVDNGISKLEYGYLSTGQVSESNTIFYLTSTQSGFNYVYDDINRLVLIEGSDGNQSHFIYDALGHLVLVQYQSAQNASLQDVVSLKYNQKSQLTERLSYLSNTTEIFLYDGMGRLSGQLVYQGVDGQRNVLLSSLSYHYDALGHIVKKVRVNDKGDSATESYVYDQMNQLSEYSCSGELCSEDDKGNSLVSESYHYNDMGSLLSVESHYANGGYSEMVYQYNNDYPDRLVSYSKDNTTYTFSYDQMGNMVIDDQGSEIHYNGFGRIDQVIQGAEISDYYYNGLNELVSVKNNNHYEQYLYSQLGLMGVDSIDSTNNEITSTQRYLYAGSGKVGVFNQSKDNQASYQGYIKDYAGSILALVERTDEAVSDIVQSYRYTPYGEITKTHTETNQANRLGYNGELTDNATSWQLLGKGTRAYNPRIRQFTSQDTWSPFGKGGINRYAYLSQANPVMYSDPSGHMLKALKARFSNHNSNQNTHAQRLQLEERSMSKSLFHTQSRHSDVNIEEYQRYIERRVNRTRNVGVRDPVQVFSGITFRVDQREPEHIFVHGFNQDYEAYTGGEFFGDRYGRTNSRGVSTSRQYTIVRQFANQRNMRAWTYVLDLTEGFHAVVHNNSMAEINSNGISSDRIMGVLAGSMYFKNPNYDGTQRHPDHEDLWN